MKQVLLLILLIIGCRACLNAQGIGIGTNAPDTSSILELKSSNKGILIPRMTKAQRIGIASPAQGLIVYQFDTDTGFYFFQGAKWKVFNFQDIGVQNNGGKPVLILSDTISNTAAQAQIAEEFGVNTQEIRIIGCTNLSSVDLSMVSKIVNITINENKVLQTVNLQNLKTCVGDFRIDNCPQLTNLNLNSLERIFSTTEALGTSIKNTALSNITFPSLKFTAGRIILSNNPNLVSINFNLLETASINSEIQIYANQILNSLNFPKLSTVGRIYFTNNADIANLSFPLLSSAQSLEINAPISSFSFPILATSGTFKLSKSKATTLSLPLLKTISTFQIETNNLLNSINLPVLSKAYSIFYLKTDSSLTTISTPSLDTIGAFYINDNKALTALNFPSLIAITDTINSCQIYSNFNLSSITWDNLARYNTSCNLAGNHLSSNQVNYLLGKFVSITPFIVNKNFALSQYPSAPPTGQGLVDKATLEGRGNYVQAN